MSDIVYFEDSIKQAEDIENSIVDSIAEEVKNIEEAEAKEETLAADKMPADPEEAPAAEENVTEEATEADETAEEAPASEENVTEEATEADETAEETPASEEDESEETSAVEEEASAAEEEVPAEEEALPEEEKKSFLDHVSAYGEKIKESAVKAGAAVKEQTVKAGEQIKDASKKAVEKYESVITPEAEDKEAAPAEVHEEEGIGTVRIADDVVAMIAMYAAQEVDGVAGMAESNTREWLGKVGIKDPQKGVRVEVNEKNVRVDLQIIMGYGYNIPATSSKVQARVKQAIENMTGLQVTDINIRIAGITVSGDSNSNN